MAMPISLPRRVKPAEGILYQELDGESVMLNYESEKYFHLNDVGTRIWQLLGESGDTETALKRLLAEYDVDEATLRRDLADIIGRLSAAGLVTVEI